MDNLLTLRENWYINDGRKATTTITTITFERLKFIQKFYCILNVYATCHIYGKVIGEF